MSARSHPARLVSFLAIAGAMAAGSGPAVAGGGPAEATGDIRFVVDASSFLRGGTVHEEIYLLIPTEDLRFASPEEEAPPEAEIRVTFRFRRWPTGEAIFEKTLDAVLPSVPEGGSGADMQLLQRAFELPEGPYRLDVTVEDRKTLGFGFFHLFGRQGHRGEAVCFFQARPFDALGLEVSDIEFARAIEADREGPFAKGSSEVIPQPGRLYGALMPELSIYYEIYDNSDGRDPAGETYHVTHEILDGAGGVVEVQEQALSARGEGRLFRRSAVLDVTGLPAGEYRMRVTVESPSRSEAVVSEGPFTVAWKLADFATRSRGRDRGDAWNYDERVDDDLIEEMRVLLSQGELEALKGMTHDHRRVWVDQYWAARDPSPGTDVNEIREEHYRRIRVANTRFASIRRKGMETDRGRIFVRYGEPDEIRSAFADDAFISGSDAIGGAGAFGETGRGRGGINVGEKQYEVWTYTERGRILGDRGKVSSGLGMRFVFVDVEGYGNFRLVESSELSDY